MEIDKEWESTLVGSDASIGDIARTIETAASKIAVVVGCNGELLGTVSDGDIRRGLLRGLKVDDDVSLIMRRNPLCFRAEVPLARIESSMSLNSVSHAPIIDSRGVVIGLYVLKSAIAQRKRFDGSVVIMAGGKGMRMRPYTENCPKPMLEVGGKPILLHLIEKARSEGFYKVFISVNYLAEVIENFFGDGSDFGVEIEYLRESSPLGTAGALGNGIIPSDTPLIVINGDVFSDAKLSEVLEYHLAHQADMTIAVRLHEWQNPYGVVEINEGEVTGFSEKPVVTSYVNAGIYVLESHVVSYIPEDVYFDMPSLLKSILHREGRVVAFPLHESWADIGRYEDLQAVNQNR